MKYWPQKPPLGVPVNRGDPLARGLIGCWLFNEGTGNKVYDSSGNGNTGILYADTHFVPGKFGSCLDFDGTGDYADFGKNPATLLANTSYSVIAWVRFDNLLSGATGIVTAEQSDPYNFALRTPGAGGYKIEFMHRGVSTTAYEPSGYGIWYQCVAVYTLNTSRDLFIDGVLFAHHTTDVTPLTAGTDSLYAGVGYTSDSGRNLDGAIDQILIYNRSLSASEALQLYITPFRMFAEGF